jgi:copper oxidase (laccase) domain-containing protein
MTEAEFVAAPGLSARHGFFTRRGGVSTGPYASLNCAWSGQDSREAILENRSRAARAVGATLPNLVGLTQVHGPDVVRVDTPWRPARARAPMPPSRPRPASPSAS